MALTLVVETGAGLSNANAFASRASVATLLEASPYADDWTSVAGVVQDQYIVEATARLSLLPWNGYCVTTTQALAFPRYSLYRADGRLLSSTAVPAEIAKATARLAFALSQAGATTPYLSSGLEPRTTLKIGPLELTPASVSNTIPGDVSALIAQFLAPFGDLVRC